MTRGRRILANQMLERLQRSGAWTAGDTLADGLSTSRIAIEDALADLVTGQLVDFKAGAGYRVKGTPLCRSALCTLVSDGLSRAVKAHVVDGFFRVGVAEHREGFGLVVYELELPMPPDGPHHLAEHLRQADAVINFTTQPIGLIPHARTGL